MTRADDTVTLQRVNATITRKSEGAVDGYGDPAETWSTVATEKVIIHLTGKTRSDRATLAGIVAEPTGRRD